MPSTKLDSTDRSATSSTFLSLAKPLGAGRHFVNGTSIAERQAFGKSHREHVPRSSHANWQPSPNRADPIDLLQQSNAGRLPELIPLRFSRMLAAPFAFLRGAARIMAADLAHTPATGIYVQACGDCHLANFGAYGTPERNLIFDVNDFDETMPAPWEWDIKRLAASIVVAGRHNKISSKDSQAAATAAVRAYRDRMNEYAHMTAIEVWYSHIDVSFLIASADRLKEQKSLKQSVDKARAQTAESLLLKSTAIVDGHRRIVDTPPLVFHAPSDDPLEAELRSVFHQYRHTLRDDLRVLLDRYQLVDIAMKVVGIGSVGTRCAIALLMAEENDSLFLQIKEARPSVLEPYVGKSIYHNQGQRVVAGQHLMQATSDLFLGWTRGDSGHDFYLRQLRDLKISIDLDSLTAINLIGYAGLCGWALARAHARSSDPAVISGYLGQNDKFDLAIANFAVSYANQTELDYEMLTAAVKSGRIAVS